jgi:hypothetical protein
MPSLTTRENVKASVATSPVGEVNDGEATVAELKVTAVPPVWFQRYVNPEPSASLLNDPLS